MKSKTKSVLKYRLLLIESVRYNCNAERFVTANGFLRCIVLSKILSLQTFRAFLLQRYTFLPSREMLQSNLNSSNTDGSFTMANPNTFFESVRNSADSSRKQIRKFSYFIKKLYVVCTH